MQVGDPFTEKLLLEASLELIRSGAIVAIQDMGAAGLTSSSAEMAARGDVGVTIDTTKVPVREEGMTPYEILLSESQERMLVVAKRGREDEVTAILEKWDLTAAVIGEVIAEPVYRVTEGDRVVAEFPGIRLVTDCPTYTPEARESADVIALRARDVSAIAERPEERDPAWTLEQLLSSPTIATKTWVYRQYDTTVRTNTVIGPGGDAAVVRVRGTESRARAARPTATAATSISIRASARRSRSCEAARNVACTGGRPMAITNNLNFGNPTRPEVYFQLREAVRGMGEACTALGTPVTGGNVSLYNENPSGAVYPTPVIGMVGLIDSLAHITRSHFQSEHDTIVLLGEPTARASAEASISRAFTASSPARRRACDLDAERALIDALLDAITAGVVRSAHDCSDGGLAVALAECCMMDRGAQHGATVDLTRWRELPRARCCSARRRAALSSRPPCRTPSWRSRESTACPARGDRPRPLAWCIAADFNGDHAVSTRRCAALDEAYHEAIPRIMSQAAVAP